MGYDLSLTVPVMHNVSVDLKSMTYNINRLLAETRWVGLKLRDLDGFTAAEVRQVFREILNDWTTNVQYFKQFEVPDWGSLGACISWMFAVIEKLEEFPDAIFEVS